MSGARWARVGAIVGGLALIAGTFGAHGLKGRVEPQRLDTFEVGVRYQFYHALALLAVGLLTMIAGRSRALEAAGWLMLVGVILFPGSLYLLVLAGGTADWLGMVAPIGGLALIAGWVAMATGCGSIEAGTKVERRAAEGIEDAERVA